MHRHTQFLTYCKFLYCTVLGRSAEQIMGIGTKLQVYAPLSKISDHATVCIHQKTYNICCVLLGSWTSDQHNIKNSWLCVANFQHVTVNN